MDTLSNDLFDAIKRANKLGCALRVDEVNLLIFEIESLRPQLAATYKLWQQSCNDAFEKSKQLASANTTICGMREEILNQFEEMCVRRGIRPEFAIAAIREQKAIELFGK